MNIHYYRDSGIIAGWGNEPVVPGEASFIEGCDILELEQRALDHTVHKVDPVTRTIVARGIDRDDINRLISSELERTDAFVDPPSDRPITGHLALDWKPYRQALRGLSKLPDAAAMLAAWPLRPDGVDAASALRARLQD